MAHRDKRARRVALQEKRAYRATQDFLRGMEILNEVLPDPSPTKDEVIDYWANFPPTTRPIPPGTEYTEIGGVPIFPEPVDYGTGKTDLSAPPPRHREATEDDPYVAVFYNGPQTVYLTQSEFDAMNTEKGSQS